MLDTFRELKFSAVKNHPGHKEQCHRAQRCPAERRRKRGLSVEQDGSIAVDDRRHWVQLHDGGGPSADQIDPFQTVPKTGRTLPLRRQSSSWLNDFTPVFYDNLSLRQRPSRSRMVTRCFVRDCHASDGLVRFGRRNEGALREREMSQ